VTAPDEIVRDLYQRFMNQGDVAAADTLIDDAFVDHSNPAVGHAGKQELIDLVLAARGDDPTLSSTIVDSRCGGDLSMVQVESTIAGKAWRELHVFRVTNARIVERWGLGNPDDAAQV
jgi:predicted SnoaL-like aldol condensation-catalyzing enzyme